jgi:hypothetical protein
MVTNLGLSAREQAKTKMKMMARMAAMFFFTVISLHIVYDAEV